MFKTLLSALILSICHFGVAQAPITYSLNLSNIHHHELRVSISFADLEGDSLIIRMPNSSPGRYALHNFAKNLYEESAFDASGNPLSIQRNTPFEWELPVKEGFVKFEYTIYGNFGDGTYLGIDARRLHMNMPATFAYGMGLKDREINLIVPRKTGWDVATQLVKENDTTYSAPDYYYFYDSPTMVGDIDWRRWEVDGQTIEIAMMHEGSDAQLDDYTEWVKQVVLQERAIFGELPKFDYGRYTFLVSYNPWVHRDGMEHRNSTVCTSQGNLGSNAQQLIGTISHEFFHSWNIERIRPASLEPFDFDVANASEALWFGEGFTNYFDELVVTRAGINAPEQYVRSLVGALNYVLNSPGRTFRSPVQMSYNAAFTDAGTANDETNYANNFISYYSYGQVIGLGLDLTLRLEYNKTLDQYMQLVWERHGKPEISYTMDDLQALLAELTRDESFASTFSTNQIYGSELPDFEALFGQFGIKMSLQSPNSAYFGNPKLDTNGQVQSVILRGTALYEAGVEKGDKLISLNGQQIGSTSELNEVINTLAVGQAYPVTYEQLGELRSGTFTTVQDPRITLSYLPDSQLKKAEIKRRNDWLGIQD